MARVLVPYSPIYGHVETMAEEARSIGTTVKRVAALVPRDVPEKSGVRLDQLAPEASPQELEQNGAIPGPDRRLRVRGALIGKVGSGFTSTASQYRGPETKLRAMHVMLLHQGMVLVGLPTA